MTASPPGKLPHPAIVKLVVGLRNARYWLQAHAAFALLGMLQSLPANKATAVMASIIETVGPFLPRQRIVLENLARAFPENSAERNKAIAKTMWRNMGRQVAEYVFLDRLFDFDPEASAPGRVEVVGEDIFRRLHAEGRPVIFFTAHTGNFELLPIAAAAYGLEVTALFRAPNNPYFARRVLAARRTSMGHLVPAKAGAAIGLARALDGGTSVGILVDQKFINGRKTTFFGHPVQTNPLLPKLARQFDVAVHPARCIRLPGNRFRLELHDAVDLPRDAAGSIDVDASCQMLNDIVETWVRQYRDPAPRPASHTCNLKPLLRLRPQPWILAGPAHHGAR